MKTTSMVRNKYLATLKIVGLFTLVLLLNLLVMHRGFGRLYEADFIQNTWLGGHLITEGHTPYDPIAWQEAKDAYFPRPDIFPAYIYPIWVAIIVSPLGYLHPLHALAFWTTLNLFLVYACLRIVYRLINKPLLKTEIVILMTLSLFSIPTIDLLLSGQYNVLLLFIFLSSMIRIQSRPDWISGMLLSLTLCKPQSSGLLLIAIFLWLIRRKRWQEIAGFVIGSSLLWVLPIIFYPNWWNDWYTIVQWQSTRLVDMTPSLWGLTHQLFESSIAYPISVSLVVIVLIGTALWWFRQGSKPSTQIWEVAPITMISLLVSFYGLVYEQVFLLLPFWLCWQWAKSAFWRYILICWILAIPLVTFLLFVFVIPPPYGLVYSIIQPLSLLPIYFYLKSGSTQLPSTIVSST
jgi:hypothetical protein